MIPNNKWTISTHARIKIWYAFLVLIGIIFMVRLFYIQIIKHNYYNQSALRGQLRQYEIAPERGIIYAKLNGVKTPIVLNQTLYTVYADPKFIIDPDKTALSVAKVLGANANDYVDKMKNNPSRYEILAKKIDKNKKDEILALKLKGVGVQDTNYRTYPQGYVASQLLGFVNDDGKGQYGIEASLDAALKGKTGRLKAITDASGVPLASNKDNIINSPTPGKQLLLTIDIGVQQQAEEILKNQVETTKSLKGSAVIINVNTGAVVAMANFPSYNPSEFYKVEDPSLFNNYSVSDAMEMGSIMKVLLTAAALDKKVISQDSTFYDPGFYKIDDATVKNVEEDGGMGTKSITDILRLSLNTGAVWLLTQLGGGQLNQQGRVAWNDYLVNHFQFSKKTGIEQSNESAGIVPDPNSGYGLNIRYANTAFGQGQSETLIQMASALSSVVNGGTYYKPYLVDAYINQDGTMEMQNPKIIKTNVISESASNSIVNIMETVAQKNKLTYGQKSLRSEYKYGGKTGTAEIADPNGGYRNDTYNGTFYGFIGGDKPEYVIAVSIIEPRNISGYAGAKAAAPVYFQIADMLINNFGVKPKS